MMPTPKKSLFYGSIASLFLALLWFSWPTHSTIWIGSAAARTSSFLNFAQNEPLRITWPLRSVPAAPDVATLSIIDENGATFHIPYIQTSNTLIVSATVGASRIPAGGAVQFVLNPGTATEFTSQDTSAPFDAEFANLPKGMYELDVNVVDAALTVQIGTGMSDRITNVGIGDIFTAIGDSITEGWNGTDYGTTPITTWLDAPAGSVAQDLRNYPQHGPEGDIHRIGFLNELNDLLSAELGYPVFIMNEGRYGYTSEQYTNYVAQEHWTNRQATLKPNRWIIHLGANDAWAGEDAATVRTNLQTILTELQSSYGATPSSIWLAKPSYYIGYEAQEATYLPEIETLITANGLQTGPDFYAHYEQNAATQYDDDIHPNLAGFSAMAQLWAASITSAFTNTSTPTPSPEATPTMTPTPIGTAVPPSGTPIYLPFVW